MPDYKVSGTVTRVVTDTEGPASAEERYRLVNGRNNNKITDVKVEEIHAPLNAHEMVMLVRGLRHAIHTKGSIPPNSLLASYVERLAATTEGVD
jgi:hypothetical protein